MLELESEELVTPPPRLEVSERLETEELVTPPPRLDVGLPERLEKVEVEELFPYGALEEESSEVVEDAVELLRVADVLDEFPYGARVDEIKVLVEDPTDVDEGGTEYVLLLVCGVASWSQYVEPE